MARDARGDRIFETIFRPVYNKRSELGNRLRTLKVGHCFLSPLVPINLLGERVMGMNIEWNVGETFHGKCTDCVLKIFQ